MPVTTLTVYRLPFSSPTLTLLAALLLLDGLALAVPVALVKLLLPLAVGLAVELALEELALDEAGASVASLVPHVQVFLQPSELVGAAATHWP
jgi:hypothetical protein